MVTSFSANWLTAGRSLEAVEATTLERLIDASTVFADRSSFTNGAINTAPSGLASLIKTLLRSLLKSIQRIIVSCC
jgi:hypothetical protein